MLNNSSFKISTGLELLEFKNQITCIEFEQILWCTILSMVCGALFIEKEGALYS